jgi:hypothetical protein
MSNIRESIIIFLIIGSLIFLKGFQSNLDLLSITMIYAMFIGYLVSVILVSTLLVKFMYWIFKYSKKKLYQGTIKA